MRVSSLIYLGAMFLKIGWIVATLLSSVMFGEEFHRSHILRPSLRSPPIKAAELVPIPETASLPPPLTEEAITPPEAPPSTGEGHDNGHSSRPLSVPNVVPKSSPQEEEDHRPVIRLYSSRGCRVCQWLQQRVDRGTLSEFRWQFFGDKDRPEWVQFTPAAHFQGVDGKWYIYPRQDGSLTDPPKWSDEEFRVRWLVHNPGAPVEAVDSTVGAGKSLLEQLEAYAGASGSITFVPDRPVRAVMEDGTVLNYSRVSGKYRIAGGIPHIVFDAPFPRVDASRFWVHFGAQIQDARYEPPATVAIGTNRGRYRISIDKVP